MIMDEKQAIRDILEVGRRMYARGFANANDGNISARVGENEVIATPSGVSKGFMTEEMLVRTDLDGNRIAGKMKPSSELKMHLAIYKNNPEVGGIVHSHPPIATSFASAGIPLDTAYLQETAVLLGVIPVAPYAMPGSQALADSVVPFCRDYNGVLLEHHGATAWAADVIHAFYRLESIEYNAQIAMNLRMMGLERPLTNTQIAELLTLRPSWGVTAGGVPKGRNE